jgi:hypothetical protein
VSDESWRAADSAQEYHSLIHRQSRSIVLSAFIRKIGFATIFSLRLRQSEGLRLDSISVPFLDIRKKTSASCMVSIMLDQMPSEVSFAWVYFPPFFFTMLLGFISALGVARLLNIAGISRFFWHPGLALTALWVLMTSLIGLTLISP